ncbi:DUF1330 domain-containing protein [Mycobacterium sp. GA-2829]|uniref:DUF1330 domain-containing protein n=1 Tax=Mycobacterium sp. GA-2829 TaxID=1772283 RepID=UPI00073FBB8C|nr:DUF1330 domain-containing protein [Mycobacterium sp. GA-2829]KUI25199.1 hypothetical protein AU194_09530 [Mycobacterium sp. GA-2829]
MSDSLDAGPMPLPALTDFPSDQPVVMVNLLKFAEPDGLASYQRYGAAVAPFLERVGAKVVYGGTSPAFVLGDEGSPWWDVILVVQYPTPSAFLEMVTSEEYNQIHVHRAQALERAELIATTHWSALS